MALRPAGPSSLSLSLAPLSLPKACFSLSPAPPLHQSPSAVPLLTGSAPSSPLPPPSVAACALSAVLGVSHPCRQQKRRQQLEMELFCIKDVHHSDLKSGGLNSEIERMESLLSIYFEALLFLIWTVDPAVVIALPTLIQM